MINEHISYSRLKSFLCPAKYFFYYILDIGIMNKYLLQGQLIHKYHEDNYLYSGKIKDIITPEKVMKDMENYIEDFKNSRKIPVIQIDNSDKIFVLNNVLSCDYSIFYNKVRDIHINHIKKGETNIETLIENRILIPVNGEFSGMFSSVMIIPDILINTESNIYIIDIKTGKYYSSYDEQLSFYYYYYTKVFKDKFTILMLYFTKTTSLQLISCNRNNAVNIVNKLLNSMDFITKHKINTIEDFKEFVKEFYVNKNLKLEFIDTVLSKVGKTICSWCMLEKCACPISSNMVLDMAIDIIFNRYNIKSI